jgi:hypothetical protein
MAEQIAGRITDLVDTAKQGIVAQQRAQEAMATIAAEAAKARPAPAPAPERPT